MNDLMISKIIDLAKREITLIDGEERNRAHPDTFHIPPANIRHTCAPGDHVKVGLMPAIPMGGARAEKLWVEVVDIDRTHDCYLGRIDNDPVVVDLRDGDIIRFWPKHILATYE